MPEKLRNTALAIILAGSQLVASAAPPMAGCANGVSCVPQRVTYGYYPPIWRRWPDAISAGIPHVPETVPTPTPAKPELPPPMMEEPSRPSDSPFPPPTETELTPSRPNTDFEPPVTRPSTEREPSPTRPSVEDLFLPFDDTPPTPPRGTSPTPPKTEEIPPARERAPVDPIDRLFSPRLDDDQPPKMPDDDPFKDEPTTLPPASNRQQGQNQKSPRWDATSLPIAGDEPQLTSTADTGEKAPLAAASTISREAAVPRSLPAPQESAPARLENISGPKLPEAQPQKTNPLRSPTPARSMAVVPTTAWVSETAPTEPSAATKRPNPLRNN